MPEADRKVPGPGSPPGKPEAPRSAGETGGEEVPALSDLHLEAMVHVAQVRAPSPRGRFLGIGEFRLPRGYVLVRAEDLPEGASLPGLGSPFPILARDRFTWKGQALALLAGPDPNLVAELAATLPLECEEEEAFCEPEDLPPGTALAKRSLLRGDPARAFAEAASIVEDLWISEPIDRNYSEPQGALAYFDYDRLVIRAATQWPSHLRDSVAAALDCRASEVIVRPTRLGHHLDGKLWYPSLLACHAALAAKACKAPARLLFTREEDFLFGPKALRSRIALKAALDSGGRLSALEADLVLDMGAHGPLAEDALVEACTAALGAYECPNLRLEARVVATDTPPASSFSGLCASQAFLALEALGSRLAEGGGIDPLEWKSRNFLSAASTWLSGERLREAPPLGAMAERLAVSSDFRRKHAAYELVRKRRADRRDGPLRGIGASFAFHAPGIAASEAVSETCTVEAVLGKDLRLSLRAWGVAPQGRASAVWREEAARILGIEPEMIDILQPEADTPLPPGPDARARGLVLTSKLAARACTAIQRRRFRETLPLGAKASGKVERSLVWTAEGPRGNPFETASWVGAVVEVEFDPFSLVFRPTGLWLCVDAGRILSPSRARQALRASAHESLEACLSEALRMGNGARDPETFFSFRKSGDLDPPPLSIDLVEDARPGLPRSIGELPHHALPGAFLAAASQALGRPLTTFPLSFEGRGEDWGDE